MKVCIFVDGENFRHSIRDLFPKFNQNDYLPRDARWTDLFDWIATNVVVGGVAAQKVRTYWYVVGEMEFSPYRVGSLSNDPARLRRILSRNLGYKAILDGLANDALRIERMKEIVEELKSQEREVSSRFAGWRAIQNGISGKHDAVEFRRAGSLTCNLLDKNRFGREKSVDVKLASDLIFLKDIYDVAVVVSGDQDYVPAVELVKDYGKRVVNVAFERGNGQLLPGGARRLNRAADSSLVIKHRQFAEFLNMPG